MTPGRVSGTPQASPDHSQGHTLMYLRRLRSERRTAGDWPVGTDKGGPSHLQRVCVLWEGGDESHPASSLSKEISFRLVSKPRTFNVLTSCLKNRLVSSIFPPLVPR